MQLYLMQHGPNLPKDEDPEESLSREGETLVTRSAQAMKRMGLSFDLIITSPKKRAKQTAAIVAGAVEFPLESIVETEMVKAMTPAEETINYLRLFEEKDRVLIAGHLPSLAEVASFLLTAGSKATICFERGGIGRIDLSELPSHEGELRWYLTPEQLSLVAD